MGQKNEVARIAERVFEMNPASRRRRSRRKHRLTDIVLEGYQKDIADLAALD